MRDLIGHGKDFEFYFKYRRKPLKDFKEESNMIHFAF